ncbi:MAG: RNA polymerase sigma-70 factor [Bacteroidota bacterium]|nr:RNA polymerase sigma-70 factor [Bacteroidota bacterium]MDP4214046.1 RNA polymerase sigma-70 factor [Bacteroidota bacterium]MDP4248932.1 RNA polymerase sigma-70 factor [Bacteroidota bacterium]
MHSVAELRIQELQTRISRFDDQQAYKELYILFYPSLFHFIRDMIKSRQVAEEIVSDVFMKIWENRKTLENILNLRVYCFVAAKNLSLNQLEKQKREITCDIDEFAHRITGNMTADPEQLMISEEMLKLIHEVVEALPPRCRMAFKLVKESGFRYKEAAEILNVSVKTIENQLAIAIKKIHNAIHFDIHRSIPLGVANQF